MNYIMLNIIDLEILEMHCNYTSYFCELWCQDLPSSSIPFYFEWTCSMFVVWSKYWSGF